MSAHGPMPKSAWIYPVLAVILFAERLTRGAAAMRERALEELRKLFSEEQIVELTLVICAANFTNRFNDGLRVEPDLG